MFTIIRKKKLEKLKADCKEYKRLYEVWVKVACKKTDELYEAGVY
jgi:hypothetical protein